MTKSELISRLSRKFPTFFLRDIEKMVNGILNEITEALQTGRRIELRGFGAFSVRKREARIARNPKNGEEVSIGTRYTVYFRTGKELREKINR